MTCCTGTTSPLAIGADEADAAVPLDWGPGSGRVITEREASQIADQPGATRGGDRAYFAASMDVYGTGVFKYAEAEDVYFSLVPAFYHWRLRDGNPWPDTFDVQLAVSRDGRRFQRLGGRRPFIRLGPEGSFSSKWVWAFPQPVRMGDELWIYYHGQNIGPVPACRPEGAEAPGWHLTGDPPAGWLRVGGCASRRGLADHAAPGLRRRAAGAEPRHQRRWYGPGPDRRCLGKTDPGIHSGGSRRA